MDVPHSSRNTAPHILFLQLPLQLTLMETHTQRAGSGTSSSSNNSKWKKTQIIVLRWGGGFLHPRKKFNSVLWEYCGFFRRVWTRTWICSGARETQETTSRTAAEKQAVPTTQPPVTHPGMHHVISQLLSYTVLICMLRSNNKIQISKQTLPAVKHWSDVIIQTTEQQVWTRSGRV